MNSDEAWTPRGATRVRGSYGSDVPAVLYRRRRVPSKPARGRTAPRSACQILRGQEKGELAAFDGYMADAEDPALSAGERALLEHIGGEEKNDHFRLLDDAANARGCP